MPILPNDPLSWLIDGEEAKEGILNRPHRETHENVKSLEWAIEHPESIIPVETDPTDSSKLIFTEDVYYINSNRVRVKLIAKGTTTPSFQTTSGVGQYRYDLLQADDTSALTIIQGTESGVDSLLDNHPNLPQDQFCVLLVRVHDSVSVELVVAEDVFSVQNILQKKALQGSSAVTINSLTDIGDVDAPSPADGDFIQWSAGTGKWVPANTGGISPHTHPISDIVNLTTVLAGKADCTHTHNVEALGNSDINSVQDNQIFAYTSGTWKNTSTITLEASSDVACFTATTQRAVRAVAPNETSYFEATGTVALRARATGTASIFEATNGSVAICATSTNHTTILAKTDCHTAIHACACCSQAGVFESINTALKAIATNTTAGQFISERGIAVCVNTTCGDGIFISSCRHGIRAVTSCGFGLETSSCTGAAGRFESKITNGTAVEIYNLSTSANACGLKVSASCGVGVYSYTCSAGACGNFFGAPSSCRGVEIVGGGCGTVSRGTSYDFYANGGGANYGPFTGSHDVILSKAKYLPGMLVEVYKQVYKDERGLSNMIPVVRPARTNNSKSVYGVFTQKIEFPTTHWIYKQEKIKKGGVVNAVGEGLALVSDINGNIAVGDLLTSTTVPGYAGVQLSEDKSTKDHVVRSHTSARAMESVNWKKIKKDKKTGIKSALIAVVYLSA